MLSYRVLAIFAISLMVGIVFAKKGDNLGYKTTYACEGKTLNISCDEGKINLVRANFGRFSISICNENGNLDWRVNCMSHHSFLIMRERCELKPSCSVSVSSATFLDPCPGTLKYLEVQYHCGTGTLPTSSTTQLPGLKVTHPATNVTAIPIGKIHTVTQRPTTSVVPTTPTIPLLRTSTVHPPSTVLSTTPTFDRSEVTANHTEQWQGTTSKSTDAAPTIGTAANVNITSELASTFPTTEIFDETHCPPIHSNGVNWPGTKVGETAFSSCPDGAAGVVVWNCIDKPVHWSPEYPDFQQCYSLWLEQLKDRIKSGDSIISAVSELAVMSATKLVFSRDLKNISELIDMAFYKSINSRDNFLDMWHRYHVLRELLMFSVQTLSNLLDNKQTAGWKELQLIETKKVISTFLENIDTSALLLSETSNDDSSFSLVKSNIWLSLQVLKAKDQDSIIFPIFADISSEEDSKYWLDMKDSIYLPQAAIESFEKNGVYKVVYIVFNQLHNYLKPGLNSSFHPRNQTSGNVSQIINSRIIGVSLDKSGNVKLNQPAVITLKHLIEVNVTNPVCVFWDFTLKDWSSEGCWVQSSNESHTICFCDHLTNFALIMDLKESLDPSPEINVIYSIMGAGCGIAIISLIITVLILFLRLRLVILMNY